MQTAVVAVIVVVVVIAVVVGGVLATYSTPTISIVLMLTDPPLPLDGVCTPSKNSRTNVAQIGFLNLCVTSSLDPLQLSTSVQGPSSVGPVAIVMPLGMRCACPFSGRHWIDFKTLAPLRSSATHSLVFVSAVHMVPSHPSNILEPGRHPVPPSTCQDETLILLDLNSTSHLHLVGMSESITNAFAWDVS